ncbi:MAG: hypothetical protein ACRDQH_19210 [Pseudonocardiaceae bacterium]
MSAVGIRLLWVTWEINPETRLRRLRWRPARVSEIRAVSVTPMRRAPPRAGPTADLLPFGRLPWTSATGVAPEE